LKRKRHAALDVAFSIAARWLRDKTVRVALIRFQENQMADIASRA